MRELNGVLRSYAWGSHTLLAELRGAGTPTDHPEAELWFGAHPADPSPLAGTGDPAALDAVIAADRRGTLGARADGIADGRLPYLLKLLAAEEALSLQAHPSLAQAREGFARENAAGVPVDAAHRNYRDDNHKPELVVAITEFEALAGFRAPTRTVELLETLDPGGFAHYVEMLRDEPDAGGIRAVFTTWITLPTTAVAGLVEALADSCVAALADRRIDDPEFLAVARTTLDLAERYPADAGVLASLLLNRITLRPGEALYLAAGNLHAYLHGLGVEIMANSDNVLRGGLTPKHVDVPELLRVLDFSPIVSPRVGNTPVGAGVRFDTPAPEFSLTRYDIPAGGTAATDVVGPRIALCTAGEVTATGGAADTVDLTPARSVWIPDSDGVVEFTAGGKPATVFVASVG